MTNKEFKDTIGGAVMYATLGIAARLIFNSNVTMVIFGGLAILRAYPALRMPFIKVEKEQEKG